MRKKLFMVLALIATMAFGCLVFESSTFAQNTNSSTTMSGEKHMSGRGRRHRRHRHRWARRHRRGGSKMKTAGGEKH